MQLLEKFNKHVLLVPLFWNVFFGTILVWSIFNPQNINVPTESITPIIKWSAVMICVSTAIGLCGAYQCKKYLDEFFAGSGISREDMSKYS